MLQVIKAEEVRDGEPRWWCPDDVYAARTLEWILTGNLHTEWRREADAFTLAIVDRPAPTPTPAPGLDLDAVEAAHAKMTAGEWSFTPYKNDPSSGATINGPHGCIGDIEVAASAYDSDTGLANAAGIVALRNAAPALIAEVRALRAQVCRLVSGQAIESDALCQHHDADLAALAERDKARAEIARLTAELVALREHVIRRLPTYQYDDGTPIDGLDEVIEYAGKEIAELRAEMVAARAVPGEVEAAIDHLGDVAMGAGRRAGRAGRLPEVTAEWESAESSLRTAIARAISDATAARGTVGGLLATAPVGAIVEFWHGATANQITTRVGGIDDRVWLWRYRNPNGEWSPWDYEAPSPDDLSQPGEIVPDDPNQRGPLPKGG